MNLAPLLSALLILVIFGNLSFAVQGKTAKAVLIYAFLYVFVSANEYMLRMPDSLIARKE